MRSGIRLIVMAVWVIIIQNWAMQHGWMDKWREMGGWSKHPPPPSVCVTLEPSTVKERAMTRFTKKVVLLLHRQVPILILKAHIRRIFTSFLSHFVRICH